MRTITLAGIFLSICGAALPGSRSPALDRFQIAGNLTQTASFLPIRIIELTNDFRREQRRPALSVSEKLEAAANDFARFMARARRYGHSADGRDPARRAQMSGYEYCLISENIAYFSDTAAFEGRALAARIAQGWFDSPDHQKNILDPDVVDIGVGIAQSAKGSLYAVQMFGRPKSMEIVFGVESQTDNAIRYRFDGKTYDLQGYNRIRHNACVSRDITFSPSLIFRPRNGDRFIVRLTPSGEISVTRTSAEK